MKTPDYSDTIFTELDLLRHGECEGGNIFRGSSDVLLSAQGREKMHAVAAKLDRDWDVVLSSPLKRCREFAEQITREKDIPLEIESKLREMHFGDWEGKEIAQIRREHEALMLSWGDNPERTTIPNSEPLVLVRERVMEVLASITERLAGKKILLVTHGGIVRVIMAELLSMPMSKISQIDVPYACASRIQIAKTSSRVYQRLLAHNFIAH